MIDVTLMQEIKSMNHLETFCWAFIQPSKSKWIHSLISLSSTSSRIIVIHHLTQENNLDSKESKVCKFLSSRSLINFQFSFQLLIFFKSHFEFYKSVMFVSTSSMYAQLWHLSKLSRSIYSDAFSLNWHNNQTLKLHFSLGIKLVIKSTSLNPLIENQYWYETILVVHTKLYEMF